MNLTIGADPEFFLKKGQDVVSAYGTIPGTKAEPYKVEAGAVQVDGMALEFNIDPARTSRKFIKNIDTVLYELRKMVPKEYDFLMEASVHFDKDYMAEQPKEALALGCDSDYNAYDMVANRPPDATSTMRTAAGHIHIGFLDDNSGNVADPQFFGSCCELTKQLDASIGLFSLLEDHNHERREMYGKAGAFRPKPYGLEYRVLSNYWIKDRDYSLKVFNRTMRAVNDFQAGRKYHEELEKVNLSVREIIDQSLTNDASVALMHLNLN